MEFCVDATGFFFAALGAGLSHFSASESAATVLLPKQANIDSAKIEPSKPWICKRLTKLL